MHLGLLCPTSNHGSPMALLKFQMAPKPKLLISSGSKKKEPRYICLSEAKASHSHKMWAEVSSLTPHFLHKGLSSSPSRWRCLLRVLWPVSRPVTALRHDGIYNSLKEGGRFKLHHLQWQDTVPWLSIAGFHHFTHYNCKVSRNNTDATGDLNNSMIKKRMENNNQ